MLISPLYTKGLGNAALYLRARKIASFWNWVTLASAGSESADTKKLLTETAIVGDTVFSSYSVDFTPPVGTGWTLEVVEVSTGLVRYEGDVSLADYAGTETIRQQIITALAARLAGITVANGYTTNIGLNVFDHKDTPFTDAELPGIDIKDTDTPEQMIGLDLHRLSIECLAVVSGDTPGENMRTIYGDVVTAIEVDRTWGGLAEDTGLVTSAPAQVAIGEHVYAGARISFEIQYTTDLMSAY